MKKYLSLLLALLLALSCTSFAFAEEDEEEISSEMKELGEYIMNHQVEAFDLAVEGYTCQSEKVEAELLHRWYGEHHRILDVLLPEF
ncbi:hypothetical protein [Anaeromassilibacillus sp. SJQ-1]|uniref:hypothetical protein n=1 Tax=Anaeromassilibacillus sp. SJQ-1 TaxID=3375419 RepID=UPI00398A49F0